MNTLYPIIRRKRRPLIEAEAAPTKPETANETTGTAPVVTDTEKGPGGEQVQGAPAAAPDANTVADTKTDHDEADHS